MQLWISASRLAHCGVSPGTPSSSGYPPGAETVKAGPPLGVGFKVRVRISSDVGAPETDGDNVAERVRVDGVSARGTSRAGVARADADAELAKVPSAARNRTTELIIVRREFGSSHMREVRRRKLINCEVRGSAVNTHLRDC